jgi:hypothetical protein
MPIVYITPNDRRALQAALKPGMVYTSPTSVIGSFIIPGVDLEFRVPASELPDTKETE